MSTEAGDNMLILDSNGVDLTVDGGSRLAREKL